MRLRFILIFVLFFSCKLFARERHISIKYLYLRESGWRSPMIVPDVSHDDNILYISSRIGANAIIIQVKDRVKNKIVYEKISSLIPDNKMQFDMNLEKGQYELEITIGDSTYIGHFEIEET